MLQKWDFAVVVSGLPFCLLEGSSVLSVNEYIQLQN